jgi:two-component system sensor histidine kinase TctE
MSTPNLLASLRFRLLIGLVCIFGLGGTAMLFLVRLNSFSAHIAVEEKSLQTQAGDLLANLRLDGAGRLVSMTAPRAWRSAYREPQAAYFTLFDPGGRPVARSPNLAAPLPLHPLAPGQAVGPLRIEGPDQDLTLTARGPRGFALVVGRSHPGRFDEADPDVLEDLAPFLVFGLFAILGLAAAWLIAVASLRPLTRASREAAAIGPGTTAARLTEDALPTEVRPLARAVNAALDRVAAAYDGEKRFIADAAHALRTPLTVLDLRLQRAQAEGSVDWPSIRRDVSELARLAAGLLDLSVAEQRRRAGAPGPVDLGRLAREMAAGFAPRLEAGAREIEVRAPMPDAPLMVRAEPGAIRDLLTALIDNALTHGAGQVTVEVAPGAAGASVLRVSDEGAGVSTERQAEVFERFHKLDANSPGAGLGLAIARQIARNAGGDVVFVAPTTVEVRLPG